MKAIIATAILALTVLPSSAETIRSKSGATANVGGAYAARFQDYIDDLENNHGATIRFMGGTRKGHCSSRHMHSCGKALDVCQLSRGRVDARCHLPDRRALAVVAARHGLFEGGRWCSSDYGHAQVGESAPACGERLLAAKRKRVREVALDANGNVSDRLTTH